VKRCFGDHLRSLVVFGSTLKYLKLFEVALELYLNFGNQWNCLKTFLGFAFLSICQRRRFWKS